MAALNEQEEAIKIAVLAMGGQGGAVLCNWIIQTAERCHCYAQSTSVPGVAQRTGATIYYIEIFPHSNRNDSKPMLALMPVPGRVDMVVAGELVESGRAILRGLVTPERTTTIVSTHRDYAIAEKSSPGDGRIDSDQLLEQAEKHSKVLIGFDMARLAEENDSVISSVLLGSIAAAGVLPFEKTAFEAVITDSGIAVEANLKGFNAGYRQARQHDFKEEGLEKTDRPKANNTQVTTLLARVDSSYPSECRTIVVHALRKLLDYQDLPYAQDYLAHLDTVLTRDTAEKGYRLTTTVARYLALWMSYEDSIRIADLKTRSSRFARVRKEVQSDDDQILRIHDYLHPRPEEICDTLPAALGSWCLKNRFCRRVLGHFCKNGKKITTTRLSGFLLLYSLAGLRRFRRMTLRHKVEMTALRQWLVTIDTVAMDNYALAVEVAECQRLVKGYGETHKRGMNNFNTLMQMVDKLCADNNAADTIRELREAALADETGGEWQQQSNNTS